MASLFNLEGTWGIGLWEWGAKLPTPKGLNHPLPVCRQWAGGGVNPPWGRVRTDHWIPAANTRE